MALAPASVKGRLAAAIEVFNEIQLVSFCDLMERKLSVRGAPDSGVFNSLGDLIRTRPHTSVPAKALASKLSGGAYTHFLNHATGEWVARVRTKDPPFDTVKAELAMILQPGEFAKSEYATVDRLFFDRLEQFLADAFYTHPVRGVYTMVGNIEKWVCLRRLQLLILLNYSHFVTLLHMQADALKTILPGTTLEGHLRCLR